MSKTLPNLPPIFAISLERSAVATWLVWFDVELELPRGSVLSGTFLDSFMVLRTEFYVAGD